LPWLLVITMSQLKNRVKRGQEMGGTGRNPMGKSGA